MYLSISSISRFVMAENNQFWNYLIKSNISVIESQKKEIDEILESEKFKLGLSIKIKDNSLQFITISYNVHIQCIEKLVLVI